MKSLNELLTRGFLEQKYVIENKSTREIAKEFGCSREPIRIRLLKYGYKMKTSKSQLTGKPILEKTRLKIIKNRPNKGKYREYSCNWKGNNAGYAARHIDMQKLIPKPNKCPNCKKKKKLDLANISGKYKRDISDWEYLCRRCHMFKDGRLQKLKERSKK